MKGTSSWNDEDHMNTRLLYTPVFLMGADRLALSIRTFEWSNFKARHAINHELSGLSLQPQQQQQQQQNGDH
ncbi:hypothetical protein BLOT_003228 [Blomia tropicalis]|nr:hypothetical protein BLOT_003228 [Blomia tropicalis]